MVLIEIPKFVQKRPIFSITLGISISLIIASIVFTFSFFLRDLIFDLLRRFEIFDIERGEDYTLSRSLVVHLSVMILLVFIAVMLYLFLRNIYLKRGWK